VNDCLQELQFKAEEKNIELQYGHASDTPERIMGDPTRLRQVLINLIGNAIKFTKVGTVSIQIEPVETEDHRWLLSISVKDSGIGIPASKMKNIFEAFSQADLSTTRQYGGTGLGLTITQRLVQLMGGQLSVQSQVGVGSTFTFTLPTQREQVQAQQSSTAVDHPRTYKQLSILVAEDHPINQKIVQAMLERWGHKVTLVGHGEEALAALREATTPFDLIYMDMHMPIMDGIEATQVIRANAQWKDIPIVALTANAMLNDRDMCIAAGMTDFLSKPMRIDDLAQQLNAMFPGACP
jgi:CheY-like chemotaxis protein/anti-sigma regulatory factor (Ser/Thr protein kinase)